jgi:S1-C subfamily serine protease
MVEQFSYGKDHAQQHLLLVTDAAPDFALGAQAAGRLATGQVANSTEPLTPLQKDLQLPVDRAAKQQFALERGFMEVPALQCDHRPQSPWLTGKPVADDCGIALKSVYAKVKDSVTQAVVKQPDGSINWGASFKYCDNKNKKCVYITNAHVAQDADQVGLVAQDGKTVNHVRVLAQDLEHDVALVDVPAGDTRPSVKIGQAPRIGDSVFTVGHPYGIPGDVISSGQVLDLNYTITDIESGQSYYGLIESDILATPGNSGGPEFNKKGEVIGIKSNAGANGTSMSIPIQTAIDFVA